MAKKKRKIAKPHEAQRPSPLPPGLLAAFVFGAGLLLYYNTAGHDFVYDDFPLILQNSQVTEQRWGEIFSSSGYRPIRTFTYAVNYMLSGENPVGYHIFNLLLHALNGVLLFRLLFVWTKAALPSAVGALLFLAHPAQTAATAYISGRKDLLAAFFVLAGLLAYTRFRRKSRPAMLIAAMAFFLLGILSKEVAIIFPALLLAADALVFRRQGEGRESIFQAFWNAVRRMWWVHGASLALASLGLAYALFVAEASRMVGYWGGSPLNNIGTSFKLFAHYLLLTVWPHPLIADYTGQVFAVSTGWASLTTLSSVALAGFYLAATIWLGRRFPLIAMGLVWFAAGLLPILHIIPFHEIAADHFLYLPLAGVALALTRVLQMAASRGPWQRPVWAAVAVVIVVFSVMTVKRNTVWRDGTTLWEETYRTAPGSYRANANLGRIYFAGAITQADYQKGVEMTERAIKLNPHDTVAVANLGGMTSSQAHAAFLQGDHEGAYQMALTAIELLDQALAMDPNSASVLSNLGGCKRLLGNYWEQLGERQQALKYRFEAQELYKAALARDDRKETKGVWYNLAQLYQDLNQPHAAVEALKEFLAVQPNNANANFHMGVNLRRLNRIDEAITYFERSLSSRSDLTVLGHLAKAYESKKDWHKALGVYQLAARKDPGNYLPVFNMAQIFYRMGNREEAIRHLEKVAQQEVDLKLKATALQHLEDLKSAQEAAKTNVSG